MAQRLTYAAAFWLAHNGIPYRSKNPDVGLHIQSILPDLITRMPPEFIMKSGYALAICSKVVCVRRVCGLNSINWLFSNGFPEGHFRASFRGQKLISSLPVPVLGSRVIMDPFCGTDKYGRRQISTSLPSSENHAAVFPAFRLVIPYR